MSGVNYAGFHGGVRGAGSHGFYVGHRRGLAMVGTDKGETPREAPRFSGIEAGRDKLHADRTLVERFKSALGLDIRPRIRALEVDVARVQGWIEGADARDTMLAETLDQLMADKR